MAILNYNTSLLVLSFTIHWLEAALRDVDDQVKKEKRRTKWASAYITAVVHRTDFDNVLRLCL
jgi:hypothetical protein